MMGIFFRVFFFFFFQAEDGIRDTSVTGVQTCALPICSPRRCLAVRSMFGRECFRGAQVGVARSFLVCSVVPDAGVTRAPRIPPVCWVWRGPHVRNISGGNVPGFPRRVGQSAADSLWNRLEFRATRGRLRCPPWPARGDDPGSACFAAKARSYLGSSWLVEASRLRLG